MSLKTTHYMEDRIQISYELQKSSLKTEATVEIPLMSIANLPSLENILKYACAAWHKRQIIEYVLLPNFGGKIAFVFDWVTENQDEEAHEEEMYGPYFVKFS